MKLSESSKQEGIQTAWFHEGKLPATRTLSGTILVEVPRVASQGDGKVVLYSRVLSHDEKPDLDREVARMTECTGNGRSRDGSRGRVGGELAPPQALLCSLMHQRTSIVVKHWGAVWPALAPRGCALWSRVTKIVTVDDAGERPSKGHGLGAH